MKLSDKYVALRDGKVITTAEQLRRTKVKVNPETSAFIQELAVSLGFAWFGSNKTTLHTEAPYLYFESTEAINYGDGLSFFNDASNQEIQIGENIQNKTYEPKQPKPSDKLQSAVDKLVELGYVYSEADKDWIDQLELNDKLGLELFKEIYPSTTELFWSDQPQETKDNFIKIALSRPKA